MSHRESVRAYYRRNPKRARLRLALYRARKKGDAAAIRYLELRLARTPLAVCPDCGEGYSHHRGGGCIAAPA